MAEVKRKQVPLRPFIPFGVAAALGLTSSDPTGTIRFLIPKGKRFSRIRIPLMGSLIANVDAELSKLVLKDKRFGKGPLIPMVSKRFMGIDNVVSSETESEFYQILKYYIYLFHNPGELGVPMEGIIQGHIDKACDFIVNNGLVVEDIAEFCIDLVGVSSAQILFGKDIPKLIKLVDKLFLVGSAKKRSENVYFDHLQLEVRAEIDTLIADETLPGENEAPKNILQALMLMAKDPRIIKLVEEGNLSADWLYDNIVAFVIGMYETTSAAAGVGVQKMAMNKEILSSVKRSGPAAIALKDLQDKESYVHMLIKETLRYTSVANVHFRYALEDVPFQNYIIKKGTSVITSTTTMMRDPANFELPDEFIPLRFHPKSTMHINMDAYVPFGSGARQCYGLWFATIMLGKLFRTLAERFDDIEVTRGADKKHYVHLTAHAPKGVRMAFVPKKKAA